MLKPGFSIRNILLTIGVGCVWIVIRYFLFEKQTFNGLLKVIDIQIYKKYPELYEIFFFIIIKYIFIKAISCLLSL